MWRSAVGLGELLGDGARLALAVVLSLAVIEKITSVRSGAAAWHPVMLVSDWRHRHAMALMGLGAGVDGAVVLLLLVRPQVGALLAFSVVALYSRLGTVSHRSGRHESCHCFWRMLNTATAAGLLARNAALLAFATVAAVWAAADPGAAAFAVAAALLGLVVLSGALGDLYAGRLERASAGLGHSHAGTGP